MIHWFTNARITIEMHSNIARGKTLPSLVHQCMHNQMNSNMARGKPLP